MGTRSTITARLSDGTYRTVYCHWDGYAEKPGVGWMLQQHYNSQELAEKVTSLGSLSSVGPSRDVPPEHSHGKPVEGHTVAYHRDLGELWEECKPRLGATYEAAVAQVGAQEYNYLWNGSAWQLISDDPAEAIAFAAQTKVPAIVFMEVEP